MPEYAVASLLGAGRKGSDKVSFTETGGRIYGSMYGFWMASEHLKML